MSFKVITRSEQEYRFPNTVSGNIAPDFPDTICLNRLGKLVQLYELGYGPEDLMNFVGSMKMYELVHVLFVIMGSSSEFLIRKFIEERAIVIWNAYMATKNYEDIHEFIKYVTVSEDSRMGTLFMQSLDIVLGEIETVHKDSEVSRLVPEKIRPIVLYDKMTLGRDLVRACRVASEIIQN